MIDQRLRKTLTTYPDRPAVTLGEQTITYHELFDEADKLIHTVQQATVLEGQLLVGILAERSLTAYAAILGAACAGWTYVPLNTDHPDERLCKIIQTAGVQLLVVDGDHLERARQLVRQLESAMIVVVPEASKAKWLVHPPEEPGAVKHQIAYHGDSAPNDSSFIREWLARVDDCDEAAPLYILFTSGTTGEPKGIRVSRANLASYLDAIEQIFDFNPTDRFSQFFGLSFDLSVHDIFVCWTVGACLHVPKQNELFDPVRFAQRSQLTVWFSVPSLAGLAIRFGKLLPGTLPGLRHVLFCGEALSWSVASAFRQAASGATLTNLYGPTEATIAITHYQLPDEEPDGCATHERDAVPIGRPFPGQEAVILDEHLQPVQAGEVGQLFLGGSQLAEGYFKNAKVTAEKFIQHEVAGHQSHIWYGTGDLAEWSVRNGLIFRGRIDDQIKLHGHRIELTEVEEVLRNSAGTSLAIVAPWPLNQTGSAERLVAYVCQSRLPLEQLRSRMADVLPNYMLPTKFIPIEQPFFNANHKLDRRQILKQYGELA